MDAPTLQESTFLLLSSGVLYWLRQMGQVIKQHMHDELHYRKQESLDRRDNLMIQRDIAAKLATIDARV
jgi:hypothetical protein